MIVRCQECNDTHKKTCLKLAFLSGADGGTRTRDLFLTKEVLYLLSYISVSMILTICGDLSLPAFLPPDGFTKEVLYLLSHISVSIVLTVCDT